MKKDWLNYIAAGYIIFIGLIFLFEGNFFGISSKNPYDYTVNKSLAEFFLLYYRIIAPALGVIIIIIGLIIILCTIIKNIKK